MNLKKLKKAELIELVGQLEKDKLNLESKIQDLNIKCQYHQFDAEASQREIKYFKKLLKDKEK